MKEYAKDEWLSLLNEFTVFSDIMLVMSVIIALVILLSINMMDILERKYELTVLRAIGYRIREILKALLLEASVFSVLGIGIGIILGYVVAETLIKIFAASTTEEFILLKVVLYPTKILMLIFIFTLAIIIAKLPAIKYVMDLNIAKALNEEPS